MREEKVKCDHCGADLSRTTNCEDWRLVLASEPIPPVDGRVKLMAVIPPLKKYHHFCGLKCLAGWVKLNVMGGVV